MRAAAVLSGLLLLVPPAFAEEAGWHYSPFPGEGDRAALGCSYGANAERHACLAVRCEDGFTVGLHIHTSRTGGDAGRWRIVFDKGEIAFDVTAAPDSSPYGAKVAGDVLEIVQALKDGAMVYIDREDGADIDRGIPLSGSLYAINRALCFCAPRNTPVAPPPQATR